MSIVAPDVNTMNMLFFFKENPTESFNLTVPVTVSHCLSVGSEQGHDIPYGIYDFPWSRSDNPDHVTGNIKVLRSEALILDNIRNKVQVQMPWSCFLNVSWVQGQMP